MIGDAFSVPHIALQSDLQKALDSHPTPEDFPQLETLGRGILYWGVVIALYNVRVYVIVCAEGPLAFSILATAMRRLSPRPPSPLLSEKQRASTATQYFRTRQT